MPEPEHRRDVAPPEAEPAPQNDEGRRQADEDFWQWVALVVLLACWLAEAGI